MQGAGSVVSKVPSHCDSGAFCSPGVTRLALARFVTACTNLETRSWSFSRHVLSLLELSKDISGEQPEGERVIDKMNSDKDNCVNPL